MKRALVIVVAVLALAGCSAPTDEAPDATPSTTVDEAVEAYEACQALVAPEFDEPDSVVWSATAEPNEGTDYDFVVDVTSSTGDATVTCSVDNTSGEWVLASYQVFAG